MKELKFSKRKQTGSNVIDSKEFRATVEKEDDLQRICEEYLKLFPNIAVVRIPNQAYRAIFASNSVSQRVKGLISSWLKGLPDLILIRYPNGLEDSHVSGNLNFALCVELKTKKGKLTQGQKHFADKVNVVVCRSFEEFKQIVDEFNE